MIFHHCAPILRFLSDRNALEHTAQLYGVQKFSIISKKLQYIVDSLNTIAYLNASADGLLNRKL